MAVANQRGVVGLVSKVSKHYAQVISVLNPKLQLSVCLQHEQSAGTLIWDGESPMYARLEDLPRNVVYEVGDTVVTSGYGVSFPRGVPVGRISELISSSNNNNFLSFRVELFTHFDRVNDVYIIQNNQPCPF
jgi:rod shape-determining protein MreC